MDNFNDPKGLYWVFKWYVWCLQKHWWIQSSKLIVFDDMIADMIHNKKAKFNSDQIIYYFKEIEYLSCFFLLSVFELRFITINLYIQAEFYNF